MHGIPEPEALLVLLAAALVEECVVGYISSQPSQPGGVSIS